MISSFLFVLWKKGSPFFTSTIFLFIYISHVKMINGWNQYLLFVYLNSTWLNSGTERMFVDVFVRDLGKKGKWIRRKTNLKGYSIYKKSFIRFSFPSRQISFIFVCVSPILSHTFSLVPLPIQLCKQASKEISQIPSNNPPQTHTHTLT
jgi:hypothetical protein